MITVSVDEKEGLTIPYIQEWRFLSKIAIFYSVTTSFVLFIIGGSIRANLIVTGSILFTGCVLSIMFYFFANQNIEIKIDQSKTTVQGSFVPNRKRDFELENYTKIVLREYIGARLNITWFCELYQGRKYISIFDGDKETAYSIAKYISEKIEVPIEVSNFKNEKKKKLYFTYNRTASLVLLIPYVMLVMFLTKWWVLIYIILFWALLFLYYTLKWMIN